jgi:hypothetical protein
MSEQQFEGNWDNIDIIQSILGEESTDQIEAMGDKSAVITFLILKWIEKHHPQKEYALIVKKASNWLKKQSNSQNYPVLYGKLVK